VFLICLETAVAKVAKSSYKLREIVFKLVPSLHNPVIDHVIISNGLNPSNKVTSDDVTIVHELANKCIQLITEF